MATLGGAVVVGTTLVIATMDGGLTVFIKGCATGATAYWAFRARAARGPAGVLAIQKLALNYQLSELQRHHEDQMVTAYRLGLASREFDALRARLDGEMKQAQKEVSAKLETFEEKVRLQQWGNKELAAAVGLGSFAYPPLGVVTILALTSDKWYPVVQRVHQLNNGEGEKACAALNLHYALA